MFMEYGVAAGARGQSGGASSFASIVAGNQTTYLIIAGVVLVLALFLLRAR